MSINDNLKQRKYYCPKHPSEIRWLNFKVSLALCPICYEQMILEDPFMKPCGPNKQDKCLFGGIHGI
jgi:hypothetical protein